MSLIRPRLPGSPFAAIARFVEACGGVEAVATFANRAPSTVYKWTDPEQSEGLPFAIAAQLSDHFRAGALADHLSIRAGGVFLPLPEAGGAGRWGEVSAIASEEFAEVLAGILRALSPRGDGGSAVTQAEARQLLGEIDDVLAVLGQLRGLAMAATGDRG